MLISFPQKCSPSFGRANAKKGSLNTSKLLEKCRRFAFFGLSRISGDGISEIRADAVAVDVETLINMCRGGAHQSVNLVRGNSSCEDSTKAEK